MGNFAGSKMTGGQSQEESNLLEDKKRPIRRSMDSIAKVLKNKSMTDSAKASTLAFYQNLVKNEDEIEQKFVEQFPNSWEAISILNQNMTSWSASKVESLFSNFPTVLQNSSYGKSINGFINQPQMGDKYVDFEQRNPDGQIELFSNHLGQYTLIEFWASWCLPCRKSNPKLVNLFNKYSHQGFTIVGVSIDEDKEKWLEAIKQDGLPWVNLTDLKGDQNQAYIAYGIDAIPDNILLDDKGIIVGKYLTTEDLEERLAEIFK
jgi:thiol-disulfide isomerase/thioredoxin